MKHSNTFLRFALILVSVLLLLSLTACHFTTVFKEDEEVRAMTEQMLNALMNEDTETARGLMKNACTDAEFASFYSSFQNYFKDMESYTLSLLSVNTKITAGITRYTAVYRMETNENKLYDITVGTSSDMEGLYGFHITSAEQNVAQYTGTITTLEGSTPVQWVLLFTGLLAYGFIIWALLDCCRWKIKQKWLYILMIILGSVAVLWTIQPGGVKLNFSFLNLLSYTALMIYQNPANTVQLRIFLPVGAIVYLCLRKKLIAKSREAAFTEEAPIYDGGANGEFLYAPTNVPSTPEEKQTAPEQTENSDTTNG